MLPGITSANALIGQGITTATTQGQAGLNNLHGSFDVLGQAEARAEQQTIRTAQAQARAMAAEGDRAGAIRVLSTAQADARGISEQTNFQIQAQIANLENGSTVAQQYGQALQSSMTGILGPVAVVTAALGVATGAVTSFADAFKFVAQLDATTKSIDIQLAGVRDSATLWAQAKAYGDEYKLTQEEINGAIVSSMPIIRQSHASMEEILSDFDRLKIRSPEKSFQDAARALGELQAGQVVSIEHLFNVPANDANRMKHEIEGGADAVQVLSQYLTESGIGMDALKANTEGAMGALKDYAKAQEDLKKAEGEFATGPGIALVDAWSTVIRGATRLLGGGGGLSESLRQVGAEWQQSLAYGQAYNAVMEANGTKAEAVAAGNAAAAASGNLFNAVLEKGSKSIQEVITAERDRVDTTRLAEAEQTKLAKALEDTGNRAADAYTKVAQAQTDYQEKGQAAAQAHTEKLADLAASNADRLTRIDGTANDARAKATDDLHDRVAKSTEDGNRRLITLETAYEDDLTSKRAAAAARLASIDADLAQKIQDDRAASARKLADIEAQIGDARASQALAATDRAGVANEQAAARAEGLAQKLAAAEAQSLQQRESRQQQYQDRLASLAERAADLQQSQQDAAGERASSYQERLAAMQEQAADHDAERAETRQDATEDRAQRHADKLAELAAKAAGTSSTGNVTTLSGGRFTTEAVGGTGADVSAAVAAEEARYQQAEAQAARDEQRQLSRDARALARQLEQAEKQRAQQEITAQAQAADQAAALASQQAQLDVDYAAQEQKASAAAARARVQLDQQYADQEQAAAKTRAAAEASAAQRDARQIADLQSGLTREREAQALREADATASAVRARAELIAHTNADLAERQASYVTARANAQAAIALQIQDLGTAYAKRLVEIAAQRQDAIATQALAYAAQQAQENAAYARQETARQVAYAKQKTQLETALSEQLAAYTKAQEDIGAITHTEANRREKLIAESYLRQAQAQRQAFNQAFGELIAGAKPGGDRSYDTIEDARSLRSAGGGSMSIGTINLPGVTDAKSFLNELRNLAIGEVRANGGDVNAYWGG